MASLKYVLYLWLIVAPAIQANPAASNVVESSNVDIGFNKLRIKKGQSAAVTCNPSGNPLPAIEWRKDGGTFGKGTIQTGNTLSISDAERNDGGIYVCLGKVNRKIVAEKTLAVEIEEEGKVSVRELNLERGQTGFVDCTPNGNPLPTILWRKGNGPLSNTARQEGTKLVISGAQDIDAGVYVCHGVVDGASIWTDFVVVKVHHPVTSPSVAKPQQVTTTHSPPKSNSRVKVNVRKLEIAKGQSGAVACFGEGSPLPTVKWTKADGKFGAGTRQDGNTLIISNAKEADAGSYVCRGNVAGNVVGSEYVEVKIKPEGAAPAPLTSTPPRVDVNARSLKIVRGQSAAIDCNPTGSPLPKVQWTKDEASFSTGTFQNGNTLVISDAQESDRGLYICNGLVDSIAVWSDYVEVEIVEATDNNKSAFDITISEGPDSQIRCELEFVQEKPADSGNRVASVQQTKGLAIFVEPKPNSIGYTCKVVVGHGSLALRQATIRLETLAPPEPPRVIVRPVATTATRGQAVFVECLVVKGDGVQIQWERVNGSLSSRSETRGSTLIFHRVEHEDAGSYRCIARNSGGEVSETTQITVQDAAFEKNTPHAPKVVILEKEVEIQRGQTRSVECKPLGTPLPTVQWIKAEGTSSGFRQEGNLLVISNATASDSGNYVCNALVEATPVWTAYVQVRVYDRCTEAKHEGYWASTDKNWYYYNRYYYDSNQKKCLFFYYKGHGGTRNNFLSESDCKYTCEV